MLVKGVAGDILESIAILIDGMEHEDVVINYAAIVRTTTIKNVDADGALNTSVLSAPPVIKFELLPIMAADDAATKGGGGALSPTGGGADDSPCICAGVPLRMWDVRPCGCTCMGACVPQRAAYHDALTRMLGDVTFHEAVWLLTGASSPPHFYYVRQPCF